MVITNDLKSPKKLCSTVLVAVKRNKLPVCVSKDPDSKLSEHCASHHKFHVPRENKHFITIAHHTEMAVETSDGLKT